MIYMLQGEAIKNDLKLLRLLVKHDLDANIIIFGVPGSGKSTLAMNIARELQKDFSVDQVAFNLEDYARILDDEPPVIQIDENFFRKRERQKKSNVILTDVFDRIRGLNIIHIWCVPTLSELDAYMRWERTRTSLTSLFLNTKVVLENGTVKRKCFVWSKEDVLIRMREVIYGKLKTTSVSNPVYSFEWDFRGIEDLILEYKQRKKESIEDAKKKLKEYVFGDPDFQPVEKIKKTEKEEFTAIDIARELNIPYTTVVGWIYSGKLKAEKRGKTWIVKKEDLEETLNYLKKSGYVGFKRTSR